MSRAVCLELDELVLGNVDRISAILCVDPDRSGLVGCGLV